MLPLSFKEYLDFSSADNKDIKTKFNEYIKFGSFPYIYELAGNEEAINKYIQGIYNTVLLKDIATRNNIDDIMLLERILKYFFHNIGNLCSINKITDTLISSGRKISSDKVEIYVKALKDSYIIYEANIYDIKGREYLKPLSKFYVVDLGMRNMLLSNKETDIGHVLENIVYLELIRRGYKVSVGKMLDKEVDFVAVNNTDTIYYQVAASVLDPNTLRRELASLDKISDHYPKYLLTMDDTPNASYNGIKKINIIDFLIGK
jgi:predicted AAA+ superfamily ATPase